MEATVQNPQGEAVMNVNGKHYRTIWVNNDEPGVIKAIDQRYLPYRFVIENLSTVDQIASAIQEMHVRGAGLIGAAAGYGMYLSALQAPHDSVERFHTALAADAEKLKSTRPTAVNLAWAVERQLEAIQAAGDLDAKIQTAFHTALAIADEDAEFCRCIGEYGVPIIEGISRSKNGGTVNILTHCNAGWLAFVDYGTATAPIYAAHDHGINVHVWVDETRPRNQGARLTAWELGQHGVPHTIIADNVGGHLMQHGLVDLVITGSDRTTYTGDVANKIGTYLKALAARDNHIPFYVALPSSTFDWKIRDGVKEIPIEQRDETEVKYIPGLSGGEIITVLLAPEDSPAGNYAFDVTPARLVTGLITERGICEASEEGVLGLYPEKRS
jgi:methylthioribose-1-phosphate isomerase